MSEGNSALDGQRGSPAPGCIILATIVIIFGGLIVLYTFVGNYQKKEISGFTEEIAAEVPELKPTAAQSEAAMVKLRSIEIAATDQKVERVLFTAEDLNVLIATLDATKDFGGQTYIESITAEGIVAKMAQPIRKGIIEKGYRFLNGEFVFKPEVRARTIAFKIIAIRPAVGAVPQNFVESYATLDFFRLDPDNEAIAKNINSIENVYTEDGHVVVETRLKPRNEAE